MIADIVPATTHNGTRPSRSSTTTSTKSGEQIGTPRASSPSKKHIKDPHASLSLFQNQEIDIGTPPPSMAAPRASAKPAPREYSDLFVGNEDGTPTKLKNAIAPKAGSKKFQASRLFGDDLESTPDPKYKSHPNKYNHFDFGHGDEDGIPQHRPIPGRPKSQHQSQWDFQDFSTPDKPGNKVRGQDVRNFTWSDDEEPETPARVPKVPQPRRDARAHFDFKDEDTPQPERRIIGGRGKGVAHNTALGLYANNVYDDSENTPKAPENPKAPLGTTTNGVNRKKDFDAHWNATDESPHHSLIANNENKPVGEDRKKVVKMMDANWAPYDQSPDAKNKPVPNTKTQSKKHTSTDKHWGIGEDDDDDQALQNPKVVPGKKSLAPVHQGFWDI